MIKYEPIVQRVSFEGFSLDVLRLDLIDKKIDGNKWFKLKYNVQKAKELGLKVLTFGGAHSNHIYSAAAACKLYNLNLICVIRGEDSDIETSPTLQFVQRCESRVYFISREKYKHKNEALMEELKEKFGNFYLIPEGGNNYEGVKGCTEILTSKLKEYDYVFCASGTGATFSGLKISSASHQKVIGISVLKGDNTLIEEANRWLMKFGANTVAPYNGGVVDRSMIIDGYHFGGYAKHTAELLEFKKSFEEKTKIPLDYVYTSKLFYTVIDLIKSGKIPGEPRILVVHSGGLQGNPGYEKRYNL